MSTADGTRLVSLGTAILSIGTILGCLLAPKLAERYGRKKTLAGYFTGMAMISRWDLAGPCIFPTGWSPFS